jgi:hypothetical protein
MANFKIKNGITIGANGITFSDGSIQVAAPAANTTGSSSNTVNTLVLRNSSGGFSAGVIVGESFIGNLNASNIVSGTISNDRTTATQNSTSNTIVLRDSTGSFSANNITISGNLIVSGTYTTINTEIIDLADNKIVLNSNHVGAPTEDAGLIVNRGTSSNIELIWDETNDYWSVGTLNFQANNFIGNLNASNLTSGTISDLRLPTSGVSAGAYGNSSHVSQIITDTYGRITSASNVAIQISYSSVLGLENSATIISSSANGASTIVSRNGSGSFSANTITATTFNGSHIGDGSGLLNINASSITYGTLSTARLPTSGVSAGTYGSSSLVPQITIDTFGRITSAANVGFSLDASNISGLATSATTDTTNASNITIGTLNNARTTAASANGASTIVSRNGSGSFSANTITATTFNGSHIGDGSGLLNINASSITYGTLSTARLPTSGVSAGTYGSSSLVPQITIDTFGRITSAANTSINRVVSINDANSITLNADTTDLGIQLNTQSAGTLTINAPTGTPNDGQKIMLRIRTSNIQTLSFNAIFQGSTDLNLPTSTSGSSKFDYMGFIYNSTSTKWQLLAKIFGF